MDTITIEGQELKYFFSKEHSGLRKGIVTADKTFWMDPLCSSDGRPLEQVMKSDPVQIFRFTFDKSKAPLELTETLKTAHQALLQQWPTMSDEERAAATWECRKKQGKDGGIYFATARISSPPNLDDFIERWYFERRAKLYCFKPESKAMKITHIAVYTDGANVYLTNLREQTNSEADFKTIDQIRKQRQKTSAWHLPSYETVFWSENGQNFQAKLTLRQRQIIEIVDKHYTDHPSVKLTQNDICREMYGDDEDRWPKDFRAPKLFKQGEGQNVWGKLIYLNEQHQIVFNPPVNGVLAIPPCQQANNKTAKQPASKPRKHPAAAANPKKESQPTRQCSDRPSPAHPPITQATVCPTPNAATELLKQIHKEIEQKQTSITGIPSKPV